MARRSSAEVRQLLLDAGARVFSVNGYARATTDEISDAARVSMSVLFRHFPTKADLFREAIIQPFVASLRSFTEKWDRTFDDTAEVDADELMRLFIADVYEQSRLHRDALIALVAVDDSLDKATTAEVQKMFGQLFTQLRDMGEIEAGRQGWFDGEDMELTARLVVGMMVSTVAYRRWFLPDGRGRPSDERVVKHMTNLILYGLRLSPPGPPTEPGQGPAHSQVA